jgi:hypothetical protein
MRSSRHPPEQRGSVRAQVLCLRSVDERSGQAASHLHGVLSRACHQHPYELGPSVDELRATLDDLHRMTETGTPASATGG